MKLWIYHKISPNFIPDTNPLLSEYRRVAEVEAIDLNEAFNLTNNVGSLSWSAQDDYRVKVLVPGPLRSTSVGDIAVEIAPTGKLLSYNICLNVGWDTRAYETKPEVTGA